MKLEKNEMIAWCPYHLLVIGKAGQHWDDSATTSLADNKKAQQIWNEYPDRRVRLTKDGRFPEIRFSEETEMYTLTYNGFECLFQTADEANWWQWHQGLLYHSTARIAGSDDPYTRLLVK